MNAEKMKEALIKIATRGWVDNALDPQWPGMIARATLAETDKLVFDSENKQGRYDDPGIEIEKTHA